MIRKDFVRRCRVTGLDHAVVPGYYDEWDPGCVELVECFKHRCIGPGLGFYHIKEIASMDEHVGFLLYDLIYRFEKIIVHLLFPEVHPALGIEAVERG